MKNKLYILLIIPLLAFGLHKYHLSLTKVNFDKTEKTVQVTTRYFIDDIENAVNKRNEISLELATKIELKNADLYLKKYLQENLKISINNGNSILKYIGKEYENDIVYFYFQIDSVNSISSIKIQNSMLLKDFDDQQNIIKLNINDKKKTFYLKNGHSSNSILF